jgi:hypothetical protein
MIILKQNGYRFPDLKLSDLNFNIQVPCFDFCCNCGMVRGRFQSKIISRVTCSRCCQKACENCTKKSSFPDFNLREEIQVCVKCFGVLLAPVSSNEAFRLRIMQQIKGQENAANKGKFVLPDHPFSKCKGLESFYESGRFSDLRVVGFPWPIEGTGRVFQVHRIVLAGEYFIDNHDLSNYTMFVTQ